VNVSEVLAETLRAAGIPFAAGHPGGEVTHLIEGLRRRGVPFYLTRHEATAAFLAAAYGELTGRPGLCIATLGPGATNLISGVAHAYLDRAPLLALTGQIPTDRYLRFPHQRLDLGGLYRPVTKLTVRLEAETVRETVHLALRLAVTERPGPVHLELPSNVAAQPAAERPGLAERWGDWLPVAGSEGAVAADPTALQAALDRLERARRPLIAVGLAALRGHAPAYLVALAERLGAPVVTTTKAKGVIPEDHPLAAGVFDMYGEAVVRELVGQSDCVLAVGLDATEFIHPWTFTVPVVYLDTVPNTDQFVPAVCEVVGPLGPLVAALAARVTPGPRWPADEVARHRTRLRAAIEGQGPELQPQQVLAVARRLFPRETVVSVDVGAHKILAGQYWTTYAPRTYLVSNGLSAMGYSLPAAMAARLVHPDRPVLAFVGDGGLGMYLGELETVARLGLRLVVVCLNDQSLSLIRLGQVRRGYPPYGVDFRNPDFAAVARECGWTGLAAETVAEVERALRVALESPGPVLVEARIQPEGYTVAE